MIWSRKEKAPRKVESSIIGEKGLASTLDSSKDAPKQANSPQSVPAATVDFRVPTPQSNPSSSWTGMTEEQVTKRLGGNLRSVLSEGTVINGRLTFDTPVKIDGKLSGEVFSTKTLVVGKTGKIKASVDVETLIIMGEVEGQVKAKEAIEVLPGGKLSADIRTKKLIINDAVFNGNCKMS